MQHTSLKNNKTKLFIKYIIKAFTDTTNYIVFPLLYRLVQWIIHELEFLITKFSLIVESVYLV